MELSEADKLVPVFQVKKIIEALVPKDFTRPIMAPFPERTREIGELLMETSKETIQTYVFWSIIYNAIESDSIIAEELEPLRRLVKESNGVVCLRAPFSNPTHISSSVGNTNLTFLTCRTQMPSKTGVKCVPEWPHWTGSSAGGTCMTTSLSDLKRS